MAIDLYGFSFLRNAVKFDYPYQESLRSLCAVSKSALLALGKGEDNTEAQVEVLNQELQNLIVVPTVWDDSLRTGGLILSQQTNLALDELRKRFTNDTSWGFYLQADELIHEQDIEQIHRDFARAQAEGCDVVSFRYIHFWQTYNQIAINKKWYPEEIRGVKLKSSVQSWGDAQSFKDYKKIYRSDVPIYHYGHVKAREALKQKQQYFVEIHHDQDQQAQAKSLAKEARPQLSIPYYGSHPKWMKQRMGSFWHQFPQDLTAPVYIVSKRPVPQQFLTRLAHKNVICVSSTRALKNVNAKQVVILECSKLGSIVNRFRYPSRTPNKMMSPLARPWPWDFWATLKLSEKGYGLR